MLDPALVAGDVALLVVARGERELIEPGPAADDGDAALRVLAAGRGHLPVLDRELALGQDEDALRHRVVPDLQLVGGLLAVGALERDVVGRDAVVGERAGDDLTAELHAVAAGHVDVAHELVLLADLRVDAAVLDREVVLLAVGVPQREAAAAGRRGGAGRLAALLADRSDQVADAARAAGDRGALVVEARVAAVGVDRRDDPLGLAGALDDVRALDREAVADVLVAGQEDVAGEARRRVPRHERGERAVADLALEREPRRGRRPGARPWGGLRIVAVRGPREHRADHSPEPGIRCY